MTDKGKQKAVEETGEKVSGGRGTRNSATEKLVDLELPPARRVFIRDTVPKRPKNYRTPEPSIVEEPAASGASVDNWNQPPHFARTVFPGQFVDLSSLVPSVGERDESEIQDEALVKDLLSGLDRDQLSDTPQLEPLKSTSPDSERAINSSPLSSVPSGYSPLLDQEVPLGVATVPFESPPDYYDWAKGLEQEQRRILPGGFDERSRSDTEQTRSSDEESIEEEIPTSDSERASRKSRSRSNTLSEVDTDDEMAPKTMPARKAKDSPVFTEDEPESILRYFEDLEACHKVAEVESDKEKKASVGRYVNPRLESEWQTLSAYRDGTYKEYRDQILKDYTAVGSLRRGSIKRLEQICKEHQRISASDIDELFTLKRQFRAEATKLMVEPALLANHTLVDYFVGSLTGAFKEKVFQQLEARAQMDARIKEAIAKVAPPGQVQVANNIDKERRRPEDRFELDEVIAMAEEIAREQNPGGAEVSLHSRAAGPSSAPSAPTVSIKQESFQLTDQLEQLRAELAATRDLEKLEQKRLMEEFRTSLQHMTKELANTLGGVARAAPRVESGPKPEYRPRVDNPVRQPFGDPSRCYYCDTSGHMLRECPAREAHFRMGKVELRQGRIYLPDGTQLAITPGKSIVARVEEYHARQQMEANYQGLPKTSVLQFSQVQAAAGASSIFNNNVKDHRDDMIEQLTAQVNMLMNDRREPPAPVSAPSAPALSALARKQLDVTGYSDEVNALLKREREELMAALQELDYEDEEQQGFTRA